MSPFSLMSKGRVRKGSIALLWLLAAAIVLGHACLQYIGGPSMGNSSRLQTDRQRNRLQGRGTLGKTARPSAAVVYDQSGQDSSDNVVMSAGGGILMGGVGALGLVAAISNPFFLVGASVAAAAAAFTRQRNDEEQKEELRQQQEVNNEVAPITTAWDSTVGALRGGLAAFSLFGFYGLAVSMPMIAAGSLVMSAVVAFSMGSSSSDEDEERPSVDAPQRIVVKRQIFKKKEKAERRSSVTKAPMRPVSEEIKENAVYDLFHRLGQNETYQ